ncbi:MAG: hypothetical protein HGA28_04965, partial [Anaerolineaceae bacterium]|nr:hypothetical protein [Anaerolineaceae bacterium]
DLRKVECILDWASDTLTRHPRLLSSWRESNCQATTLKVITEDNSSLFSAYFHAKRWQVHSKNIAINNLFNSPKKIQNGLYLINQNIIDQGKSAVAELFSLMDEIGEKSSWKGLHLSPGGNSRGAAETLQSIAGYPACLRFSQDTVEFSPLDYAIDSLLGNRESDLVILMGYPHELSKEMITHLGDQDTILISATKPKWIPMVQIPVRRPGIDIDGTVIRMDGVAFALEQIVESDRPNLLTVLGALSGVTSV